ncbi:MAG: glycoside hydrolase family 88 protein [Treponema sp.]|jgi:unsaturated rhamnogalacturonyl hydrolase|nr:glycoside hydrolase family 88 protein [Treponema sp.]
MALVDKTASLSERMARSVMNRYVPEMVKWRYTHGLVLESIFTLGEQRGKEEYCRRVKNMYDAVIGEQGGIADYREDEYNLDMIKPGKILLLLHKRYGEEKYRIAVETLRNQLRNQPRTKDGGFWHKKIYPWQMWLDGLFMQGPFYAACTAEFGDPEGFNDLVLQFVLMESRARDEETGLLYHGWDESRSQPWANPDTGCSPQFWGRAMGWYCMALVDTLELIPPFRWGQRETLKAIANRLVCPILKFQDRKSGLWYQILDKGREEKNYLESSASAMFVYFLLKAVRSGILGEADVPKAREAALAAYDGLLRERLREDSSGELHLMGICKAAGLGGAPYRDGSFNYYMSEPVVMDDFKGVGPFILASLEREALDRAS